MHEILEQLASSDLSRQSFTPSQTLEDMKQPLVSRQLKEPSGQESQSRGLSSDWSAQSNASLHLGNRTRIIVWAFTVKETTFSKLYIWISSKQYSQNGSPQKCKHSYAIRIKPLLEVAKYVLENEFEKRNAEIKEELSYEAYIMQYSTNSYRWKDSYELRLGYDKSFTIIFCSRTRRLRYYLIEVHTGKKIDWNAYPLIFQYTVIWKYTF